MSHNSAILGPHGVVLGSSRSDLVDRNTWVLAPNGASMALLARRVCIVLTAGPSRRGRLDRLLGAR